MPGGFFVAPANPAMTTPTEPYLAIVPADKTSLTDDERIENIVPLPPPEHLIRFFPIQGTPAEQLVVGTRRRVREILHGRSDRILVVMGPCSIHDPAAALEYAEKLRGERERHAADVELIMRVYFEKPRTTVGWKGLINDPYLNGSFRINEGLRIARDLLVSINRLGVPAGCEFLDVISPQYIGDLVSWGAIGARTTESQVHRELASGLSAPVGFKNGTDGNVRIAVDAILAARQRHHFLSVHKSGQVAIVETRGNEDCHIILRGGRRPNYDAASVRGACAELARARLPQRLMIDLSHANAAKRHRRQVEVARDVVRQIAAGSRHIIGAMVESHLVEGRQDLQPGKALRYGQSITDACLGWAESVGIVETLAEAVRKRRRRARGRRA
jgi:3-deoxy-7-phosphoheptulonate synthase